MKDVFKMMDIEILLTPMPEEYANKLVMVFCNDCTEKTETQYHIIGLKCKNINCGSYNTSQL